jgi:hypothetical protein
MAVGGHGKKATIGKSRTPTISVGDSATALAADKESLRHA